MLLLVLLRLVLLLRLLLRLGLLLLLARRLLASGCWRVLSTRVAKLLLAVREGALVDEVARDATETTNVILPWLLATSTGLLLLLTGLVLLLLLRAALWCHRCNPRIDSLKV